MEPTTGGCLCGRVRFTAAGAPERVGLCHCADCRRHHGALFYGAAVFRRKTVRIEGKTSAFCGRHFCPRCGSSVFAVTGDEIELHLGAMDDPDRHVPGYECWTQRRVRWMPRFPGTQCFPRNRAPGG